MASQPRRWRIPVAVLVALSLTGVVVITNRTVAAGSSATITAASPSIQPQPQPQPQPDPAPVLAAPVPATPVLAAPEDPSQVTVTGARLFGWALLDADTGATSGSANLATVTNTVESMIKPWIVADYLRRLADAGKRPTTTALGELTKMIVDSNDVLAEKYYRLDGADSVVRRMISVCGLTDVTITPYWWSLTTMTPGDAVRYGQCLADGQAAGPQWTTWVLDTMRQVRGGVADQISDEVEGGHWGIIDGLPAALAAETSIKNGWTAHADDWHIDCLAINPHWTLAVMLVVSSLRQGADACASVAAQLVVQA